VLALHIGDWVEVLGDETELGLGHEKRDERRPGTLARIKHIDEAERVLTLSHDVYQHHKEGHPKVRRWDQEGDEDELSDGIQVQEGVWLELEDGVQIQFSAEQTGGAYRAGDYWVFAARTPTRDVEKLDKAPPHGVEHHYCPLALKTWRPGRVRRLVARVEDGTFVPDLAEWEIRDNETVWDFRLLPDVTVPDGKPFSEVIKPLLDKLEEVAYSVEIIDDRTIRFRRPIDGFLEKLSEITVVDWSRAWDATEQECLPEFPPLTEIEADADGGHPPYLVLRYVGGDGQEGHPDRRLPCLLEVGVEDESGKPREGVPVVFSVGQGCGFLTDPDTSTINEGSTITVNSRDDGIARAWWTLGQDMEPGVCCQVTARLQEQLPQGGVLPIHFKATVRTDGDDGEEKWPVVVDITWLNDAVLGLDDFNNGLTVTFSDEMDPHSANTDNFIVTLELPHLEPPELERDYYEHGIQHLKEEYGDKWYPGHRIFIVPGEVEPLDDAWQFVPKPSIPDAVLDLWLMRETDFFGTDPPSIRCRVVLKGNTILDLEGHPLDGEAFGSAGTRIKLELPSSGDGHKGGDFESWFYLYDPEFG
jgi:hypothetical protein